MEHYKYKTREEYLTVLDSILPDNYIVKRDIGSGKTHTYIPVAIKQAIADDIFHQWNIIDENYFNMINEIVCTVKIQYMPNYPGADFLFCTGSAAVPIQTDSGSSISNFPNSKKKNALEYNIPGVRQEACGNALETLGNIFGRSLNRKIGKLKLSADFKIRNFNKKEENGKS